MKRLKAINASGYIKRVLGCNESCPSFGIFIEARCNSELYYCFKVKSLIKDSDTTIPMFPDWCPLPDHKEDDK